MKASKYDIIKDIRIRSDITVKTIDEMYAIKTYRRKWGMVVAVYDEDTDADIEGGGINGLYQLVFEKSSDIISDNDNWDKLGEEKVKIEGGLVSWLNESLLRIFVTKVIITVGHRIYEGETPEIGYIELELLDPGMSRIDIVAVRLGAYDEEEKLGEAEIFVLKGDDDLFPIFPQIERDEYELTKILIPYGAIGWDGSLVDEIVYDENKEWQTSVVEGTTPCDFESALYASTGSVSIEIGTYIEDVLTLQFLAPHNKDRRGYGIISFDLKLKAPGEIPVIIFYFYNLIAQEIATQFAIIDTTYFDKDSTEWQQVFVRVRDFGIKDWGASTYTVLRMYTAFVSGIGHEGFFIDNIMWSGGISRPLQKVTLIGDVEGEGMVGEEIETTVKKIIKWKPFSASGNILSYEGALVNTGTAVTLTLPASPKVGDTIGISDSTGAADTNPITIAGNGNNIMGGASLSVDVSFAAFMLVYNGSQWIIETYLAQNTPDYVGIEDLTENVVPKKGATKLVDSFMTSTSTYGAVGLINYTRFVSWQNDGIADLTLEHPSATLRYFDISSKRGETTTLIARFVEVAGESRFMVNTNTGSSTFNVDGTVEFVNLPTDIDDETNFLVIAANGSVKKRSLSALTGNELVDLEIDAVTGNTVSTVDNTNNTLRVRGTMLDTTQFDAFLGGWAAFKPWFGEEYELPESRTADTIYCTYEDELEDVS